MQQTSVTTIRNPQHIIEEPGVLERHEQQFRRWVDKGGPEPHEYPALTAFFHEVHDCLERGLYSREDVHDLIRILSEEDLRDTIHGFSFLKPHGYAGDYEMIERIYQSRISTRPHLRRWDLFSDTQASAKAVRNRKSYFIDIIKEKARANPHREMRVLNLASGPGRDVAEALQQVGPNVTFDCVDLDPDAISYATELLEPYHDRVRFIHKNVLRFRAHTPYDLVWSAGLFDYFSDAVFVHLLKRARDWVVPGGELIIGNFSEANPTRAYMEVCLDWFLNHRSPEHLTQLAISAGIHPESIRVEQEPEGVNLFLRVRNDSAGEGR